MADIGGGANCYEKEEQGTYMLLTSHQNFTKVNKETLEVIFSYLRNQLGQSVLAPLGEL